MNPNTRTAHTATAHGTGHEALPGPVRLLVIAGPDRGADHLLREGTALMGSAGTCELVLSDPTVSKVHARVELLEGRVRVTDSNSKNGTRFQGARIRSLEVPLGRTLQLGSNTLVALLPGVRPRPVAEVTRLGPFVTRAPAMQRVLEEVRAVGPSDAAVLIAGETGSGKSMLARALHEASHRALGPYQVVDCGVVTPGLVQAALFGYVRGAFTGARGDKAGLLELADGGTVVFDNVDQLPLELQATLLRVVEVGEYLPLGAEQARRADFRVVAVSQRPLEALVREGKFRQDLFYRLGTLVITVPPLRDRVEDLPALAEQLGAARNPPVTISPAQLTMLAGYRWPGNVRELENYVERVGTLGPGDLGRELFGNAPSPVDYYGARDRALKAFEYSYLKALMLEHHGVVANAARAAGVGRSYFYRMLEEHGLGKNQSS